MFCFIVSFYSVKNIWQTCLHIVCMQPPKYWITQWPYLCYVDGINHVLAKCRLYPCNHHQHSSHSGRCSQNHKCTASLKATVDIFGSTYGVAFCILVQIGLQWLINTWKTHRGATAAIPWWYQMQVNWNPWLIPILLQIYSVLCYVPHLCELIEREVNKQIFGCSFSLVCKKYRRKYTHHQNEAYKANKASLLGLYTSPGWGLYVVFVFFNAIPLLYDLTPREPMFLTGKDRLSLREISSL